MVTLIPPPTYVLVVDLPSLMIPKGIDQFVSLFRSCKSLPLSRVKTKMN